MSTLLHVGDNLDLNIDTEDWQCGKCQHNIGPGREDFKRGLLVAERDPSEVHRPMIEADYNFSPNPEWIRILEFYCPNCGAQLETEYLPPGHPITHTTEIDVDDLKARLKSGEILIKEGHIELAEEAES